MRLEVYLIPAEMTGKRFEGKTAIVIDLLRATSTVITALMNGCSRILPVETVEEAFSLKMSMAPEKPLLGGERKGLKIDGFDLGNSPVEYSSQVVSGRSVILTTTNGTVAIKGAKAAEALLTCSLLNLTATAKKAVELGTDVVIICAGRMGRVSLEDAYCAGRLLSVICEMSSGNYSLDDGANTALALANKWENAIDALMAADHGRYLMDIGLGEDLQLCSRIDIYDRVVMYKEGCLSLSVS